MLSAPKRGKPYGNASRSGSRRIRGATIRVSTVATRIGALLAAANDAGCGAALRAGNATGHLLAADMESARLAIGRLRSAGMHATLEAASEAAKAGLVAWDASGSELEVMQRVKADFDPLHLLNRGRLYGVI